MEEEDLGMKRYLSKVLIVVAGLFAFLGLNFKDVNAFYNPAKTQISANTGLYLQHSGSIMNSGDRQWHESHSSHASHASHASHFSHYSGR